MVQFLDRDEVQARALLAAAGTRVLNVNDENVADVMAEVVGADAPAVALDVPPPSAESTYEDLGAWHVQPVNEFHIVTEGKGLVEFWTGDGVVSLVIEPGDIMVNISGAEHRYLPLTRQVWDGRASGPLAAQFTGRDASAWAVIPD